MNKEMYERLKAGNHAAQAKRTADNAELRERLKLSPGDPIPNQNYSNNRATRRYAGQRASAGRGRVRRAATRMVVPGFVPPWRQTD